ncbi:transposase [Candidatus Brocadia sinica JPN1]|uniref:Transposase n=1 Tax=Candidatus Brocadia sinica JPN1 TaxID=1197129 RepID=A0ABQ0K170_9BACT|nr:transposase [Candidatus Brocadia sinica JPN1]GIK11705.1 MAG: hypothetical protein BroJett002_04120 [Candidatus Brocadia sinica]GJQ18889.1 MAG: hypothetical protein HBSIN01_28480 [Candidatus Brocadia sinica]
MKTIAQNGERRQPKIKTEMSGKGLTVHAALLPVLTFMYGEYGEVVIQAESTRGNP